MSRHRVSVPLRWSDVDAYGHVNNVQYLRLLEEARVLTFGAGLAATPGAPPTGLVVARSEIEYLRPLEFRAEPVAVDLWVTAVRAAEVDLAYQVKEPRVGVLYAQALTVMVAFDLASATPRRFSPAEAARLTELHGPALTWRRRIRSPQAPPRRAPTPA
jgi:acyl-CoA thioester hydrolase